MNKKFVLGRAISIARKEIRHILRDPFTLSMALGMPVALVLFFGYVFDFDVRDIHTAILDRDQTHLSRSFAELFSGSQYFRLQPAAQSGEPFRWLSQEKSKAVIIIEPGFAEDLKKGRQAHVQVGLDGADNQTTGMISAYLAGIQIAATKKFSNTEVKMPITLQPRFLYNPELNSRWFIIPGLTVVVVGILSILLTALTVAREWETGSMELLLSTPVQPLEIIVGKLFPYTMLGLGGIVLVYIAARVGFGVPFNGNHFLFIFSCFMFLATTLSQGLVISVVTRQQQLAMQLANISGMLPSLLLSGFIFPVESMPLFFQYFTSIIPAKWFMMICRGLFLKGASFSELIKPFLILAILNFFLISLAVRKFKKDLEP